MNIFFQIKVALTLLYKIHLVVYSFVGAICIYLKSSIIHDKNWNS
jgi:hypothetical protein